MNIRTLKPEDVTFSISIEEEETPIIGHFCSDEPEKDRELEAEIIRRLHSGDMWAWCTVKVTATWNGVHGTDYLGCCSYDSEADFVRCDDYYQSMKDQALEELNRNLACTFTKVAPLIGKEESKVYSVYRSQGTPSEGESTLCGALAKFLPTHDAEISCDGDVMAISVALDEHAWILTNFGRMALAEEHQRLQSL